MSNRRMPEPTGKQIADAARVEETLCHELTLLRREGVPPAELLSGVGMALANLITCTIGPDQVAPWLERNARLVRELQSGGH